MGDAVPGAVEVSPLNWWSLFFMLVLTMCSTAHAESRSIGSQDESPWAIGVSPERRAEAVRLLEEGNLRFAERSYSEALKIFRRAIEAWDHPGIRFNISECLIELDQPLEAYANLLSALAHEGAALDEGVIDRAKRHKKLLEGQLAWVDVTCDEPDVAVMLDGQPMLVGPGSATRFVAPGSHQIVARKDGYVTQTGEKLLLPQERFAFTVALRKLEPRKFALERRWSWWVPWVVVGAGVGIGATAGAFTLQARSHVDTFDAEVARLCPTGCLESSLPESTAGLPDRAAKEDVAAVVLYAVGGTAVATGLFLAILNTPEPIVTKEGRVAPGVATIVPLPGGGGIAVLSSSF